MLIDLQFHSTYSDGYLEPAEAVSLLAGLGVKVASMTDHNTIRGLDEFRRAALLYGIKAISGLELYVKYRNHHFNILWYGFDDKDPDLHAFLRVTQMRRRAQVRRTLNNLQADGFRMDVDRIVDKYNHYVPLNRVVDDFMAVPANAREVHRRLGRRHPREEEVMREFFLNKKRGVLRESYVDFARVARLKKKIGGFLILCHPGRYGRIYPQRIETLQKLGLDGLEVLSPHHSLGTIMYLQYLCREMKLIATGGSDFHKPEAIGEIQRSWDYFRIDSDLLPGVERIIG